MKKRNYSTVGKLLRRNLSRAQLIGFVLSNFIGLAIVIAGIQFYIDFRPFWDDDESFINKDYVIVNKRVKASHTVGTLETGFTPEEIKEIQGQSWLRDLGTFSSADFQVRAYVEQSGKAMSTDMFLEAIPDNFIDVESSKWKFKPGDTVVPIIISKDYLTLYNFGFASSTGMPQLTEGMLSSIPLTLRLTSRDGGKVVKFEGKIVGFSGRLNTILVPESFMEWGNINLGSEDVQNPQRLILDVSSPGDIAIKEFLEAHDYERAGEDRGSQAAYFLNLIFGLIIAVGALITILSFFILLLSVALLMQKNRSTLHTLIMLGYNLRIVGRPYEKITIVSTLVSYVFAVIAMLLLRSLYISGIAGLNDGVAGGVGLSIGCGTILVVIILIINVVSIRRRVRNAFYV